MGRKNTYQQIYGNSSPQREGVILDDLALKADQKGAKRF